MWRGLRTFFSEQQPLVAQRIDVEILGPLQVGYGNGEMGQTLHVDHGILPLMLGAIIEAGRGAGQAHPRGTHGDGLHL